MGVDTAFIPRKYLNPEKNYKRLEPPILRAKQMGFMNGLDFGCGSVGSMIVARLHGLEVVGLDIPYGIDDSKEGERNRNGLEAKKIVEKSSVHLGQQNNLNKMGYRVVIRDTNNYPWDEFADNEFDFILAYFALSKEWVNHSDTLDFSTEIYRQRLTELIRITRDGGVWYIYPKNHIHATEKHKDLMTKKIQLRSWR